ncbi:MAG TPA: SDR family NAD(P)-dependent oxidoreductase [Candidatus Kapabacteria bacterium]|nr:SDR family NAD(P)-dependent oxidoreductase [Candidatus Kapabacteria bacterium]
MKPHERIIITGASSGIGRALALEYAARRARMVLVARRERLLAEVADRVSACGGEAVVLAADAAERSTGQRALKLAQERFGGVDVAIMNAGRRGSTPAATFDASIADDVMAVNYLSVCYMLEAMLPAMRSAGGGTLVAIGSLAAYRGMPESGAYNASKAALATLMESLRTELRHSGIHAITIAPGFVRTEMTAPNQFRMPFLMEADEAARRIIRAIDRRRPVYRFPLGTSLVVRALQAMPVALYDRLAARGYVRLRRERTCERAHE